LLVSVAGGITLTRANSADMLGTEIRQQLFARPATLYLASGVCAAMCLIPGLPGPAFLLVAAGLFWSGRRVTSRATVESTEGGGIERKKNEKAPSADLAGLLRLEDLSLEIGFQLIPLVDEKQGGTLLNRVRALRRHLSAEMGFLVPPVHISDNLRLRPREYVVSLRGIEIGRWQIEGSQMLAVSGDPQRRPLAGKETWEPAFGVPAVWIASSLEEQAIAAGYSVVDAGTIITTHLGELVRCHAHELLGRAETKRLMDSLNDSHPKLLEELVPKFLTLGEVERVLEQLLRERVSIRDLGAILEELLQVASLNKSQVALVEAARQALGRRLVAPLLDQDGQLPVLLLDPALEEEILATVSLESNPRLLSSASAPPVPIIRRLTDSLKHLIGACASSAPPVLLCPSPARYYVRRWLEPFMPRLAVVAAAEIPPEVRLKPAGTVG
jgi:flagellar biosynthesis protein FlhA